jgi:ferric-dicitrate binding protein FerR (iron transport regulator)
MRGNDREAAVRRLLEQASSRPVPPEIHTEAVRRGSRMLRRRTLARRLMWLLILAAALAFAVWALTARPWVEPPSDTTPPLTGW